MKEWVRVRLWAFCMVGLLGLSACGSAPRVKTHPDPDVRLQSMRKALESLQNEPEGAEERNKKKGVGVTDENAPLPSAK